jgi:hypothetical protein
MAYRVTISSTKIPGWGVKVHVYPDAERGREVVGSFSELSRRNGHMFEVTGAEVPDEEVYLTGIQLFEQAALEARHVA